MGGTIGIKEILREKSSKNPEKFFPVDVLKEKGLVRRKCKICGRYFWTSNPEREICGDHEPYGFIGNSPAKRKLNYVETWKDFSKFMEKRGYKPIKRYPVIARWREDLDFVIASIADFQPWVVKGISEPPAKKLTIPQFCLRFTDVDNVGVTGRHYTGFVMIGQHAFVEPEEYDINQYFRDLLEWFLSLGIPIEEFIFHEDAWAGGGNAGTSIEIFSRGLELANQVYMQYEVVGERVKELEKLKVLDMGMGHERIPWFTYGSATSYDIVFPSVIKYLKDHIKDQLDYSIFERFMVYASSFNIEEAEDIDLEWKKVSNKLDIELNALKRKLEIFFKMYSLAEHTRSLLVALSDGALPSNIGGGYNLRLIFRRSYKIYEELFSDLDYFKIFELHKIDLKGLFPEVGENLDEIFEILENEKKKYYETKKQVQKILSRISIDKLDSKKLYELYISQGIHPEDLGVKPDKVFKELVEKHKEISKKKEEKKKIQLKKCYPKTERLAYNWRDVIAKGKIIGIEDNKVIFDKSIFYPTGGGQIHDTGYILLEWNEKIEKLSKSINLSIREANELINEIKNLNKVKVYKVENVDGIFVHYVDDPSKLEVGKEYIQVVNWNRRKNVSRHHSVTHILIRALRRIYGKHVWQEGAEKTEEYARLDISHFKIPTKDEIVKIEEIVNRIIEEGREIKSMFIERGEAERKYGFRIYQGGVVPGRTLRIVEIEDWDVEACGGTHLDNTQQILGFKIKKVEKISDSIIRFEYVAGETLKKLTDHFEEILRKTSEITKTDFENIPKAVKKFFDNWKESSKKLEKTLEALFEDIISRLEKGENKIKVSLEFRDVQSLIGKYCNKLRQYNFIIEGTDFVIWNNIEINREFRRVFEIRGVKVGIK